MVKRPEVDFLSKELENSEMKNAAAWTVTGILVSHPNKTGIHILNLSLTFYSQELLCNTNMELKLSCIMASLA